MAGNRVVPDAEAAARNAVLLAGYDYDKYPGGSTGYTGMNRQRIIVIRHEPAVRTRIGPRGNYKGAICRLDDGSLVAAVCRRATSEGLFGIHVYASDDKGVSWAEIGQTKLYGKEMSLTLVPDGSLLLTVENSRFTKNIIQMTYYRSTDRGRTWLTYHIDGPQKPRNLIVENDGSLLMVRALRSVYLKDLYASVGKPYVPSSNLELSRSIDGGLSWTCSEGDVDWDNTHFGETSSVRLPNGNLLASLRSNPPGTHHEATQVTYLTESTDNGKTWCTPWVMTNTAEVQVNLLLLRSGLLLATYTNYHLPFGVCAITSDDHGRTWCIDAEIQLAISADALTGWPVTIELDDGELITSYAITAYLNQPPYVLRGALQEGPALRSVCEAVRWRLPDTIL